MSKWAGSLTGCQFLNMIDNIIIEYSNVGIYKHAKLEIQPGKLIIIKGENNNGKSLLFYSLELMLLNDPLAKTLINNDALKEDPDAEMCITISQGSTIIEMHRSVNDMYYVVNGKPFKKLNKANLFNKVENIKVPGFIFTPKIDIPLFNMHSEDRGFFPLSYNDQGIFTLYEQLLGLINSKVIIKHVQNEIADISSQLKTVQTMKDSEEIKQSAILKCLDHTDINVLESSIKTIEDLQKAINDLTSVKDTVKIITKSIPNKLTHTINNENLQGLIEQYKTLYSAIDTIRIAKGKLKAIKPLQSIEVSNTVKTQIEIFKALKELTDRVIVANTELKYLKVKHAQLTNRLVTLKEQAHSYDICPLCGHIKEATCQH